jgi:hypothetical protein
MNWSIPNIFLLSEEKPEISVRENGRRRYSGKEP